MSLYYIICIMCLLVCSNILCSIYICIVIVYNNCFCFVRQYYQQQIVIQVSPPLPLLIDVLEKLEN